MYNKEEIELKSLARFFSDPAIPWYKRPIFLRWLI